MSENNYTLVPIRAQDWEPIRQWRNEQRNILRQDDIIIKEEQEIYTEWYYAFEYGKSRPGILLYSFLLDNELIGSGGFGKIDWKNNWAETSFLLDRTIDFHYIHYKEEFMTFLKLLESHTAHFGLHRWYSETFAFRTFHIQCLEEYGFEREGILVDHVRKDGKYIDVVMHGRILK